MDMTLVKFAPMQKASNGNPHFEHVLESLFGRSVQRPENEPAGWSPHVDVEETDNAIVLAADLPGLAREDIRISTKDEYLTIQGDRSTESNIEGRNFRRIERVSGKFNRTFKMPCVIQSEQVDASYNDGVLRVTVTKSDSARRVEIEIKG
jgi:HSP20 family protein